MLLELVYLIHQHPQQYPHYPQQYPRHQQQQYPGNPFAMTYVQAQQHARACVVPPPQPLPPQPLPTTSTMMFHEPLWLHVISVTSFGLVHAVALSSCRYCPIQPRMGYLAFPSTCVVGVKHGANWSGQPTPMK